MTTMNATTVNGIDSDGLRGAIAAMAADPGKAAARFRVRTAWKGGTRSETRIDGFSLGGQVVTRSFRFGCDEPTELFGTNSCPSPQEVLMGALAACITVGWVAGASLRGIRIDALEIETEAQLDLRGFLGLDRSAAPGFETLRYRVCVLGDGTRQQFEEIHESVRQRSPNYFTLSRPIVLEGELVVG